jgi:signal transduction histidine kinase
VLASGPEWHGYTSRSTFVAGAFVAAAIAAVNTGFAVRRPSTGPIAVAAVLVQALVLVLPRARLAGVTLAVVAATTILYAPDFATGYVPHVVAFFAAGAHGSRRLQRIAIGLLAAFAVWAAVRYLGFSLPPADARWWIVVIAVLATCVLAGARNQEMQRSARAAVALEERERAEEISRTVAEERARIARELHDVLAHTVSVIALQADAAASVLDDDPERARTAITTVSTLARQSLDEIRRLLGVLRAGDDARTLGPQPGLDGLRELAEQTSASGVQVSLVVEGDGGPLPPGLELCAYRIVQESLTNVLKHAGEARASVRVERHPDALVLEITDGGRGGAAEPTPGHGLIGMRERVALFGGDLQAGPVSAGGWRVRARLPTT